ncbi:MAG: LysR family transcriptional regulator [Chloroflexota bacterium]|nr:LysR family transcriptional regulator [Chloroflexota bacterium]
MEAGRCKAVDVAILETFLLVAERGNFTAAAQERGLTQPGITRQIQRLERSLGVSLFQRTGSGVRLTKAGERYLSYAKETLARHRRLLEELSAAADGGELRIAASTTPGEFLVPRLVAGFRERHPALKAAVFTTDSQGVVDELLEGRWDVGFVGARYQQERLRYDAIAADEVLLAVPSSHEFAAATEVPLQALAKQRFLEREDGSGTILSLRRSLAQKRLSLPDYPVAMTLSNTQAILSAVRAGYGIGFVSSLALHELTDGRVVGVRLAGLTVRRLLYLVRDRRRSLSRPARGFVDFVLSTVEETDTRQ